MVSLAWVGYGCLGVGIFFIFVSFVTPAWLQSNSIVTEDRLDSLGLWEVCLHNFHDPYHRYDTVFEGCMWIYDVRYDIIRFFIDPPFFVAVQTLYTLGLLILVVTSVVIAVLPVFKENRGRRGNFVVLGLLVLASIMCTMALIIFGALGDTHRWFRDYYHNYISWSFALGGFGTFMVMMATAVLAVQARIHSKCRLKRQLEDFALNPSKD